MDTTIKEIRDMNAIIYECRAGSHAYGLNTATSDLDTRGIYRLPLAWRLNLDQPKVPFEQIGEDKNDTIFYELRRFISLAREANPNIIELLWVDPSDRLVCTPVMDKLIANRKLFISKRCFHSFTGYSYEQIKKAKGQNKKVNNPMPKEKPTVFDFCWVILDVNRIEHLCDQRIIDKDTAIAMERKIHEMPSRPVPLKDSGIDLTKFHCAKLEHTGHIYRLYYYGDQAKGVFRGNDMIVPESISMTDEVERFAGLMIYNVDLQEETLTKWKQYWEWVEKRNDARWVTQEAGEVDYDAKNMMHCIRLLCSGENILRNGEPIVKWTGEMRDFLMDIRRGKYTYDYLIKYAQDKEKLLRELYDTTENIPYTADQDKIIKLYEEVVRM